VGCAGPPAAGRAAGGDDSADRQAVSKTIDGFEAALRAADFERVSALLDPGVVILESGGAERSREEYLASHAKSDAAFMKDAQIRDRKTDVKVAGDAAWAMTTSKVQYEYEGKPRTVNAAETMILRRGPGGWKIVHIHWSSRAAE
jgi:ketosteroid isomerase-like protein